MHLWAVVIALTVIFSQWAVGQTQDAPAVSPATPPATAPAAQPRLGANLGGIFDWNSELPFVDMFRMSRAWISQRQSADWGKGPELKLDEHGWVKELEEGCYAETPLTTLGKGRFPSGEYVVLYEGDGEIRFSVGEGKIDRPGRITVNVEPGMNGFFLQIRKTNPQNYIRNIRVIMPGFENTYQQEPFHPNFLHRWQGMACLRFMDWQATNGSKMVTWADRPKMTDATWSIKGVPVEVIADLCNRLKADAWVCMPHAADDEYVREFSTQLHALLDPSLKVYVEYSNEVWNNLFAAQRYAQRKAKELGIGPPERLWEGACMYYGQRSLEIFRIWQEVFGDKRRLVRVVSWQAASSKYWLDGLLMSRLGEGNVDALAIAPYMTLNVHAKSSPSSDQVAAWTIDQVLDYVETRSLPDAAGWMQRAADVAKKYNVTLLCYEAGQHLVPIGEANKNGELVKKLTAANRHRRMGEIYAKYYQAWEASGGDLICHFSSVGTWGRSGSWGLLESYNETPESSPKMMASLNWAKSRGQKVNFKLPAKLPAQPNNNSLQGEKSLIFAPFSHTPMSSPALGSDRSVPCATAAALAKSAYARLT